MTRCHVRRAHLAALALLSLGTGCTSPDASPVARQSQPILFGTPSGPADDAVVFLRARGTQAISQCTATLVAPNLIITVRHCVAEFANRSFTCTAEGDLDPSSLGGTMGPLLPPEDIEIRLGADSNTETAAVGREVFSVETPSICRSDIAMVLLDRELLDVPIMPLRLNAGNERGEEVRVVGYGVDEERIFGKRNTRSGVRIHEVGRSDFNDDPDAIPPRTFLTLGPTLCIGDSGGPAITSGNAVTAVWSQVVGDCMTDSARNYFTQVAPFKSTIVDKAFAASGHEPLPEEAPPTGDGGTNAGGASNEGGVSGEAPVGGEAAVGGEAGSSGAPASTAGSPNAGPGGEGGRDGGGEPVAGQAPAYRGPRKEGGLQCTITRGVSGDAALSLTALLFALAWRRRSIRARIE